jgi:hypothetical protein
MQINEQDNSSPLRYGQGKSNRTTYAFQELCQDEPRLLQLYRKVQAICDDHSSPSFCANTHWYGYREVKGLPGSLRDALDQLVGYSAENPKLRTREAHDLAHRTLYGTLPDCRNCCCVAVDEIIRYRKRHSGRRPSRRNRKVASGTHE